MIVLHAVLRIALCQSKRLKNMCWVSVPTGFNTETPTTCKITHHRSSNHLMSYVFHGQEDKRCFILVVLTFNFLPDIFIASNACRVVQFIQDKIVVISTILLMGLAPWLLINFLNHCGDSPTVTLLMVIPLYRGQACLSKNRRHRYSKATFWVIRKP